MLKFLNVYVLGRCEKLAVEHFALFSGSPCFADFYGMCHSNAMNSQT